MQYFNIMKSHNVRPSIDNLMLLTSDKILDLFAEHERILFDRPDRDYEVVHDNVDFMKPMLERWSTEIGSISTDLDALRPDSLAEKESTVELVRIYESTLQILSILELLKQSIVAPGVEEIRKEFENAVSKSVSAVTNSILFVFHPNGDSVQSDLTIQVCKTEIGGSHYQCKRLRTKLAAYRAYISTDSSWSERLANNLLNAKIHGVLIFGCVLALISFGILNVPIESHFVEIKTYARSFSVLVATLWFQGVFMMRWKRSQEMMIWVMVWATLINIWIYELPLGLIASAMLYAFPLRRLNTLFKDIDDKSVPDRFFRRFSLPYALLWSLVTFVLTHEMIWLIGLTVWVSYNVLIRETSYRFFRQTYDLIENVFSENRGRIQREAYFVASSSVTAFAALTGVLGHLSVRQISELMEFAGNFSLVLITILLAIQAVIPGINLWSNVATPRRRVREIHMMLRANRGLGGFMFSFFLLFVLASLTRWILQSVGDSSVLIASLEIQFLTNETGSIVDVLLGSEFSPQVTLLVGFTVLLVVCLSLLVHCILLLYYMFSTASVFLLPMLDSLLSTPAYVESISNSLTLSEDESHRIQTDIIETLTKSRRLNGCIIEQIFLSDSLLQSGNVILAIHFIADFPDKSNMYKICKETARLFYGRTSKIGQKISSMTIGFYRNTLDQGKHNIFAVQLNNDDWQFFDKQVPGMSDQYKIEHVFRAKVVEYVLPESQIF